jgi:hypothetical protein
MTKDKKTLQTFIAKAMIDYNYDPEEKYWENYQTNLERFNDDEL